MLTKVLFIFSVISICSCWYYHPYYYNPYDRYFRKPYSYFTSQNSNCEKWCYSYTTPNIHCCVYKERPNTCPYSTVYCTVPLAPSFTLHFRCGGDTDCPMGYKCCEDSCFSHNICKSHNIEWLKWNTYPHGYNYHYHPPSTAPTASSSPRKTEEETELSETTTTTIPHPSTFVTETSSELATEVIHTSFTTTSTKTSDSPESENEAITEEAADTDTDEALTTAVFSHLENVTTTEGDLYTSTVTTYEASRLENDTTGTGTGTGTGTDETSSTYITPFNGIDETSSAVTTPFNGIDETSSTVTTPSTSTTQNVFGTLFSLFGKNENKVKESDGTDDLAENSVDTKETEVTGSNETDATERSDDVPVVEGSGSEVDETETESMSKEGNGNGGDKKNSITFVDDEDSKRKRRSNVHIQKKNKEGKDKIILDIVEDNNDLFFDRM